MGYAVCFLLVFFMGCGSSTTEPKKVDNSATRYAEGLVSDVEKAKAAAAKANQAVLKSQKVHRDAFEQTE